MTPIVFESKEELKCLSDFTKSKKTVLFNNLYITNFFKSKFLSVLKWGFLILNLKVTGLTTWTIGLAGRKKGAKVSGAGAQESNSFLWPQISPGTQTNPTTKTAATIVSAWDSF